MQTTTQETAEQHTTDWQHHVDAFNQSGLSKDQYCRDHDIIYHLFMYWSAKLCGAVPDTAAPQKASIGKLVPATLATRNTQPFLQCSLQIHLPNGVHVSGIDSGSVGLVGRLIEQL